MIGHWQGGAPVAGGAGKVAHPELHGDDWQPEGTDHDVKRQRKRDPAFEHRPACLACQKIAGEGLGNDGGGGEERVGDHHDPGNMSDQGGVPALMRHHHKKRDARAGSKQDRGPDDVQEKEDVVRHRSSAMARTNRVSSMDGRTLTKGPRGSAQRSGAMRVPPTR